MNSTKSKAHWSFWVIVIFTLLWNIGGCINFIMQMNPEMITQYRASEQAIINSRPLWATLGFALGVFAGALGCFLLLLKKSISYYLLLASLLGVLLAVGHTLNVDYDFSTTELLVMALSPFIVAAFLVWYARFATRRNWIN